MEQQNISHRLDKLERALIEMKKHMVDIDSVMTEEDYEALLSYRREKKEGKLVSHEIVKKELGL